MAELTKHQRFEILRVNRSNIKEALYNPRVISKENEEKLHKILKTHGLVETMVWNKRTGNLISGHQRIRQIDSMENSKDYEIDIAVIDVSEEDEVKLNIILNNPSIMGQYDKKKLHILHDTFPEIDFKNDIGFSTSDMKFFDLQVFDKPEDKENKQNTSKQDKSLIICFDDDDMKYEFMRGINQDEDTKFIKYEDFIDVIKEEYRI